jgi:hypothetical protein
MSALDPAVVRSVAAECVPLVSGNFGQQLDYSLNSLAVLDRVCGQLPADGQRLDLWYRLTGASTGEVCLRTYGGEWVDHDGAIAVLIAGLTGLPFRTAHRLLSGEDFKSLASFARSIPAILERSRKG